jgi:hypothetical protein
VSSCSISGISGSVRNLSSSSTFHSNKHHTGRVVGIAALGREDRQELVEVGDLGDVDHCSPFASSTDGRDSHPPMPSAWYIERLSGWHPEAQDCAGEARLLEQALPPTPGRRAYRHLPMRLGSALEPDSIHAGRALTTFSHSTAFNRGDRRAGGTVVTCRAGVSRWFALERSFGVGGGT